MPAIDKPIDLREAVERYGQSERRLRGWIHKGLLPASKPGKEFLVRVSDLEELFAPKREARTG